MAKRGRPSAAALEIQSKVASIEIVERPDAPYDLTDEQSAEWWAIVNRMPADWFTRETQPILAQYCRHIVTARRIASTIETALADPEPISIKDLDRLYKMQDREGRAISSLATKMRITQQATTNHRGNKQPDGKRKPWEG